MPTINTLTHVLRHHMTDASSPLSLGHAHQLIAAACGYTSLAVLQASNEPANLDSSMHWIVDLAQIEERGATLGLVNFNPEVFASALVHASRDCAGPQVHLSDEALAEDFVLEAQEVVLHNSSVADEMANTNCTGPWEEYLEFSGSSIDKPVEIGAIFEIDFQGQVQGDSDQDRPYSGHSVNVTVQLRFEVVGKRLVVGPPAIEVVQASLDYGYYDDDFDEALTS